MTTTELVRQAIQQAGHLEHKPVVKAFFHTQSFTYSYVVHDPVTKASAVIDSVLDFDTATGTLSYESVEAIIEYIKSEALLVAWHLETHMHADHLSAATYLRDQLGGKVAIGKHIRTIQGMYADVFGVSDDEIASAITSFDHLWEEFETFSLGLIPAFTFYAPGHTPADIVYVIGDAVFVGDSLFMPDFGSARCDFPQGSAAALYDSVQLIYTLPEAMRMFLCHDYLPEGRTEYSCKTSVGEQKKSNIHLKEGVSKVEFVTKREARDATLSLPKYMIPALQVNVRAGVIPQQNGKMMLRWPVNSIFSKYSRGK